MPAAQATCEALGTWTKYDVYNATGTIIGQAVRSHNGDIFVAPVAYRGMHVRTPHCMSKVPSSSTLAEELGAAVSHALAA